MANPGIIQYRKDFECSDIPDNQTLVQIWWLIYESLKILFLKWLQFGLAHRHIGSSKNVTKPNSMKIRALSLVAWTVALVLQINNQSFAQTDPISNHIHYGGGGNNDIEVGHKVIQTSDGHFVIAGVWQKKALLTKVNACGDTLWMRHYPVGSEAILYDVLERPSGELVAVGNCDSCGFGSSVTRTMLIQTDQYGSMNQISLYGDSLVPHNCQAFAATNDGGYILTGHTTEDDLCNWIPGDVFLMKLDANYNESWTTYQNSGTYNYAFDVIQVSDGGYVTTGSRRSLAGVNPTPAVLRFDSLGTLVWDLYHGNPAGTICSAPFRSSIIQLSTGNLANVSTAYYDSIQGYQGHLTEIRFSDGFPINNKMYGDTFADGFSDIVELPGNELLISGEKGAWGNFRPAWIVKLDPLRNVVASYQDVYPGKSARASSIHLLPGDSLQYVYTGSQHYINSGTDLVFGIRKAYDFVVDWGLSPEDKQLYPRPDPIIHSGTLTDSLQLYTEVEYLLIRNDTDTISNTPSYSPVNWNPQNNASFTATSFLPAGLNNYTFEVHGIGGFCRIPESIAKEVVVGDVYVFDGGANARAFGTLPADEDEFIRTYGRRYVNDTIFGWQKTLNDPDPYIDNGVGKFALRFAKKIVDSLGIPIAVINGGNDTVPIQEMLPNPTFPNDPNTHYGQLLNRMQGAGVDHAVSGIVFYQGETNAAVNAYSTSQQQYKAYFDTLLNAWNTDYPNFGSVYMFQLHLGCDAWWIYANQDSVAQLGEAQRQMNDSVPQLQILSTTTLYHDGCLYYPQGYEKGGDDLFPMVATDRYGVPYDPANYPPNYDSIWIEDPGLQEIMVRFRDTITPITWTGWTIGFRLEGVHPLNSVVGGTILSPGLCRLYLNTTLDTAAFTGLSYIGYTGGDQVPIINSKDLGMLTFKDAPVTMTGIPTGTSGISTLDWLKVFPNPATDQITIQGNTQHPEQFTLTVQNAQGMVVSAQEWQTSVGRFEQSIQMPFAKGIYLIRLENGAGEYMSKSVVLR